MKTHTLLCLSGILVTSIPNVFGQVAPKSQQKNEEIIELIEDKVAVAKAAPKPTNDALYTDVYGSY